MDDKTIAETTAPQLVILREKSGLNPRQFAIENNIDPSHYLKAEKGTKGLSPAKIVDLSAKYGVTLDWLLLGLNREEEENQDNLVSDTDSLYRRRAPIPKDATDRERFFLSVVDRCVEAAADSAFTAKKLSIATNTALDMARESSVKEVQVKVDEHISSMQSVEEKVDRLIQELYSERVGRIATQTLALQLKAKAEGREYDDVYREFLGSNLAEAAGFQRQASNAGAQDMSGRKKQSVSGT